MLRCNSKKAKENLRKYIVDNYCPDNFANAPDVTADYESIRTFIVNDFKSTHWNSAEDRRYYKNMFNAFEAWCSGLPSVLDTCYYYNRSACDDIAMLLEETDEERAKYKENESRAEHVLTSLLYRELFE